MKVLINNLFDGKLERGIVNYVRNMLVGFKRLDINYKVLNSSNIPFSGHINRSIFNIIFVLVEQIYIPIISITYYKVISPYNTGSIILSIFTNKQIIIIHDFIPYNSKFSFSLIYLKLTIYLHSFMRRDVAFITEEVKNEAFSRGLFSRSNVYILPNTFFEFEKYLSSNAQPIQNEKYILLCSGLSPNKDLSGALKLARQYFISRKIIVLGVHSQYSHYEDLNIQFLSNLPANEVASYYKNSDFVWVHSIQEGFGRCVVEARMANKKVLASDIPPFLEQSDRSVFFYINNDNDDFESALRRLEECDVAVDYVCMYNTALINQLKLILNK